MTDNSDTSDPSDIEEAVTVSDSVGVSIREYYSFSHIRSASLNVLQAAKIEEKYEETGQCSMEQEMNYLSHISTSLINSAAFIESCANEFFSDLNKDIIVDSKYNLDEEFLRSIQATHEGAKRQFTHNTPPLQKYQWMLSLSQHEKFDRGKPPYQDMNDLMSLRNYLIHYEPEDIVLSHPKREVDTSHIFIDKLENKGIKPAPFKNENDTNRYLSYECGKWAVDSSLEFTDQFFSKFGTKAPYDHIRSDIQSNLEL